MLSAGSSASDSPTCRSSSSLLRCSQSTRSSRLLHEFEGHSSTISHLRVTPDGLHVISASFDYTLKLWSLEHPSAGLLKTLEGHTHYVLDMDISSTGTIAASCSYDKTALLWDLKGAESSRRCLPGGEELKLEHSDSVFCICFDATDTFLYTSCGRTNARSIAVWCVKDGVHLRDVEHSLVGGFPYGCGLSIFPGTPRLALSDNSGRLHVWTTAGGADGEIKQECVLGAGWHTATNANAVWSSGGKRVVVAQIANGRSHLCVYKIEEEE